MTFGQRLLNLLYEHDISQKQLAIELNIASTTMNGYVNNRREPDFKILKQIANYFHVSTDYLLGNDSSDFMDSSPPLLTNHEIQVLYYYRALNPEQKEVADGLLKLMYKQNTSTAPNTSSHTKT